MTLITVCVCVYVAETHIQLGNKLPWATQVPAQWNIVQGLCLASIVALHCVCVCGSAVYKAHVGASRHVPQAQLANATHSASSFENCSFYYLREGRLNAKF